ncbi:helix-hairpin-helix domain-containing protein [Streptomyces reniochalinae]|uniref:Helix-hairpin-helix domain-containing protein n=1 Tax=Streptomyces reniochalinae TaxID=2250578 RepID=A0A367EWS7_9ACTN|nr:helix-hairpin-helix domain-containing protein [Streptomyces reniochalinae]RCG21610.1 helix-hairpin-helix domain-containing protein [Streptomyces reniochalinae]
MADWERSIRRARLLRAVLTTLWALLPVCTLGFATVPMMIHAAARMQRWWQAVATAPYLAATALVFTVDPDVSATSETVFGAGMFFNLVVGTGHAFAIRGAVWRPHGTDHHTFRPLLEKQREALAAQRDAQAAREAARALAASDPRQALELRIGRVDLGDRPFPDGGLVDVNNVPETALAEALHLPAPRAAEVARARGQLGGFSSVAELSVTTDLPPRHLDAVADRLIFLPPSP